MEKEATLTLDTRVDVKLRLPLLKRRLKELMSKALPILNGNGEWMQLRSVVISYLGHPLEDKHIKYIKERLSSDGFKQYQDMFKLRAAEDQELYKKKSATKEDALKQILSIIVLETTKIKEIPCTCKGDCEQALLKMLSTATNTEKVICYNSCMRTLFAAFKRQLKRVFPPNPVILAEFKEFVEDYMKKYVFPALDHFDYNFGQWFNRLPSNKQRAIRDAINVLSDNQGREFITLNNWKVIYGLFCKREKQQDGGKNRAIANISNEVKYILGPICWFLEDVADKFFPGYCGQKNWEDLENFMQSMYNQGFRTVLQGDGSGFDLSQHAEIRQMVDKRIYDYLADQGKIHHVPSALFKRVATKQFRTLEACVHVKDPVTGRTAMRALADASVYGTVFSGSSDTTLMNTLRMSLYNMFTLERKGLKYGRDFYHLAKGDDFMVFVKDAKLPYEKMYYEIWEHKDSKPYTTDYKPYGIGQILKFLNVGDFSTIDFCSTTAMLYEGGTKVKLARKPERMSPLAHYSRSALQLILKAKAALYRGNAQLAEALLGRYKQYLIDQAHAIDIGMGEIPFYKQYSNLYRELASQIPYANTLVDFGSARSEIPLDEGHITREDLELEIQDKCFDYGHDYIHSVMFRNSSHIIPDFDVLTHMLSHYSLTSTHIDMIEEDILENRAFSLYTEQLNKVK